ncbi:MULTISPECIES: ATP-dependent Clp protease proteolytic subunit [unclassified Mesorhizobium]|uniref:ATP-dependent Clp protease proteolytic subunit n=2 Tax=Mesorhizobium TaxID=68287 RepID=UPI000FCB0DD0|nr:MULTISPECIES: ATP-dependent Clp protease proteolytic subunit [unclassified Mesorhizobium]AZV17814.1 peptidase S14 [Mesorhizobium sp. M7A.F.Ce.TU.012.03.2.1]RVD19679.1 peptidase S14 [Mesorhizobium sp. M7A.F.Ca.ET.027.02.1.1]RVD67024.1 peptidase S14 [Mesorhizobium sp. M7A.F.Ca.ET.027.03.2.1]RWD12403.1 MAG: peptidase S14 [Mesorhizobium sp.]RWO88165.1 MAG: peptidase S14 [Mesorhizobium sp.]
MNIAGNVPPSGGTTPTDPAPELARLLFEPNISINGPIGQDTVTFFLGRLEEVRRSGQDMLMELNTSGGDADAARRIALEIRLFRLHSGRRAYCVGKTQVYSAGVTIFAAFDRHCRFLTEDAVLLVHERRMDTSLALNGPMRSCIQIVREELALLETAEQLEMEGFRELVNGSSLTAEELYQRATNNCYIHAEDACRLGLVAEVLG